MKKLLWIPLAVAVVAGPLAQAQHGGWDGHHGGPSMHFPYSSHYAPYGHFVHDLPLGFACLFLGGLEYCYWEGMYYQRAPNGYVVVPAPVGAVVTSVPDGCQQVVVDGTLYYLINGVTYMRTSYGYQVVPMPSVLVPRVVAAPPAPQSMIVNVPGPSTPPPPPPVMNVPVPTPMVMPGQAPSYAPTPAALVPNPPAAETAVAANEAYVINIPNAKGTYTPVALKRSGTGFVGPQGEFYTEFPRVEQLKLMYGK
jgi:hypothetical protein